MSVIVVGLVSPVVAVQQTVPKTETVSVKYGAKLDADTYNGLIVGGYYVNVTNQDSTSGSFTVTMNEWETNPIGGVTQSYAKHTESFYIASGASYRFYVPRDWTVTSTTFFSFGYTVSAPTKEVSYQETQTEYKSILSLLLG